MKNYIQIGDQQITCEPTNEEEYNKCINTCVAILGTLVDFTTRNIKDDKKRTESALQMSGKLGAAIAKNVIYLIAEEKAEKKVKDKLPDSEEGNADA